MDCRFLFIAEQQPDRRGRRELAVTGRDIQRDLRRPFSIQLDGTAQNAAFGVQNESIRAVEQGIRHGVAVGVGGVQGQNATRRFFLVHFHGGNRAIEGRSVVIDVQHDDPESQSGGKMARFPRGFEP